MHLPFHQIVLQFLWQHLSYMNVYKPHMKTLVHSNKTVTSERMSTHCESTRTLWSEEDGKVSVYFLCMQTRQGTVLVATSIVGGRLKTTWTRWGGLGGQKTPIPRLRWKMSTWSWSKKGKLISTWLLNDPCVAWKPCWAFRHFQRTNPTHFHGALLSLKMKRKKIAHGQSWNTENSLDGTYKVEGRYIYARAKRRKWKKS